MLENEASLITHQVPLAILGTVKRVQSFNDSNLSSETHLIRVTVTRVKLDQA